MTTRAPRKSLSADDLKKKLAAAKEALKALEKRAFAGEITEAINKSNIPSDFKIIKQSAKDASDIAILEAIGLAVGIKRLIVTQSEVAFPRFSRQLILSTMSPRSDHETNPIYGGVQSRSSQTNHRERTSSS